MLLYNEDILDILDQAFAFNIGMCYKYNDFEIYDIDPFDVTEAINIELKKN